MRVETGPEEMQSRKNKLHEYHHVRVENASEGMSRKDKIYAYPCDVSNGMLLIDFFAAHALSGLLAADKGWASHPQALAQLAYDHADAMMKERGK